MTNPGSISFDHAADFYDLTRALSPETAEEVTDLLVRELGSRTGVIEVGVGTGRIALPLAERGIPLVGVDLARNMLRRLIHNAGETVPFPLVQADATRLPFADSSFDGGVVSWVLHLIEDWRTVLTELRRTIGRGGVLAIDVGGEDGSIATQLTWRFRDIAGVTDWPRGVSDRREVDHVLVAMGAQPRPIQEIVEIQEIALEDHIHLLEQGVYSVTWGLDAATRSEVVTELRTWAENEHGSLKEPRRIETIHSWRAYDL